MTSKADSFALRSIVITSVMIVLLVGLRGVAVWVGSVFASVSYTPVESVKPPAVEAIPVHIIKPPWRPPPESKVNAVEAVERVGISKGIEPEIRRAEPVSNSLPPVAEATRLVIPVSPSHWSAPVRVPLGKSVAVSFKLGRIKIQRNGGDAELFARGPSKSQTYHFDTETRSLRFKSVELYGGEVVVEFVD